MKRNFERVLVFVFLFLMGTGAAFGQLIFPDGSEQSSAGVVLTQTVVVSPVGTDAQNGTALLAALAGITDNAAGIPYLIKLEPGLYDLGTSVLTMKEYVDIEGSGQGITHIRSTTSGTGTIVGADFTELRSLSVWHGGGGTDANALYASGLTFFTLIHVQLLGSGGSANNSGALLSGSTLKAQHCTFTGTGGTDASGLRLTNTSTAVLKDCKMMAGSASSTSYGAAVGDSYLTARQCEFYGNTSSVIFLGSGVGYALVAGSQIAEEPRFWITDIGATVAYAVVNCFDQSFNAILDDSAP